MTAWGVPLWRWALFAVYLGCVGLVLYGVVRVVMWAPGPSYLLFLSWLGLALAWPHLWFVRGSIARRQETDSRGLELDAAFYRGSTNSR